MRKSDMPMRRGPCPALAPRGPSYFMQPRPPPSLCKRPKATSWMPRLWFLMPNSHLKNAFAPSKLGTHTTKNPSPSTAPTKPMEAPANQPTRRRWPHTPTCSASGIRPRPTAKAPMREKGSREKAPMRTTRWRMVADCGLIM